MLKAFYALRKILMVSFRATEDELYVLCFHSYWASLLLFGEKENRLRVQFKPRYSIKYNQELACALCVTVTQCPRIITLVPSLLIVEVCACLPFVLHKAKKQSVAVVLRMEEEH